MSAANQNSLHELETIFDHLPDGIITIDAHSPFRIRNVNSVACRILNAEKQEVNDKQMETVFKGEFQPLLHVVNETFARKRAVRNFTVQILPNEEESKSFLVNTNVIDSEDSDMTHILLVLHDISEATKSKRETSQAQRFEALIGSTAAMKKIFSTIDTIAPTDAAVLIYGETGTGKELVARAIHRRSDRAKRPFIPVQCSAIASSLLESTLFGHTKGAFTGAIRDKPGRFEIADGGTIFLDEIATLSPQIQVSLLRVLQEKSFERVGGMKSVPVDVRIISATNRRLPELIKQGVFRKDLYYRVKVLQINLPPLRKRKKDIPLLVDHFVEKFNRAHNCQIVGMTNDTRKILRSYSWPGNVRELENAIEHAVIISQYGLVEPWHLPEEIHNPDGDSLGSPIEDTVQASEQDRIRSALKETGGNVSRAANILGMHRTTLWRKMREFDIPRFPDYLTPS